MKRLTSILAFFLSLALAVPGWAVLVEFASLEGGKIKVDLDIVAGAIVGIRIQNSTSKTAIFSTSLAGKEAKVTIQPNTILSTTKIAKLTIVDGLSVYLGAK